MADHTAVHIETRDTSHPHAIAYVYRCCGDERTDSSLTVVDPHLLSDDEIEMHKANHASRIERLHAAKLAGHAHIEERRVALPRAHTLGGSDHAVTIDTHTHRADEVIEVNYLCCGSHAHQELMSVAVYVDPDAGGNIEIKDGIVVKGTVLSTPRFKTASELSDEMDKHAGEAARRHANHLRKSQLAPKPLPPVENAHFTDTQSASTDT